MAAFLHLVKGDSAVLAGAVIESNLREADARVLRDEDEGGLARARHAS